jgi:hypothetical protein
VLARVVALRSCSMRSSVIIDRKHRAWRHYLTSNASTHCRRFVLYAPLRQTFDATTMGPTRRSRVIESHDQSAAEIGGPAHALRMIPSIWLAVTDVGSTGAWRRARAGPRGDFGLCEAQLAQQADDSQIAPQPIQARARGLPVTHG